MKPLNILMLACSATATSLDQTWSNNGKELIPNANHIFNALHSSMRQFGSSLNHNGMSLFIASVPAGVELYHGTSKPYRVNGTEWLAFEPEHALIFARPPGAPRKGRPRPRHGPEMVKQGEGTRRPIVDGLPVSAGEPDSGYLHTYRTKHKLRLLYLDGQSAAKSRKGTLDVQDRVVTDLGSIDDQPNRGEFARAKEMCRIAREDWDDRIDGILRMEGGFEIILCSFEKRLNVARIAQAAPRSSGDGPFAGRDHFDYYRAIAARYDGIGGGRVSVDYDKFITLFAHPDAIDFDETGRPRVKDKAEVLKPIKEELATMATREDSPETGLDWQGIADMYVMRYADRLETLASGDLKTEEELKAEVRRAIRPFLDFSSRNSTLETQRCVAQFLPTTFDGSSIAARAIGQVIGTLCSTLVSLEATEGYDEMMANVHQLKEYLAWTAWKKCRGCSYDEICFLPIWPVGTAMDFEHPKCRSDEALGRKHGEEGYWDDFGEPHGKDP